MTKEMMKNDSDILPVDTEMELLLAMEQDKLEKLKAQIAELKSREAKNGKLD